MPKKNNEYWLGKIKLWFALRGGIGTWLQHHREEELCENCRYYQSTKKVRRLETLVLGANGYRNFEFVRECKRKQEFRGKLMVSSNLKTIEFCDSYPFHYICAEM